MCPHAGATPVVCVGKRRLLKSLRKSDTRDTARVSHAWAGETFSWGRRAYLCEWGSAIAVHVLLDLNYWARGSMGWEPGIPLLRGRRPESSMSSRRGV